MEIEHLVIFLLAAFAAILALTFAFQEHTKTTVRSDNIDWFKRITDLATLAVITFGLYFAWDQAKRLTESIDAFNRNLNVSILANVSSQTLEQDKIFINEPHLTEILFEQCKHR
jgi:hypothetical protein